MTRYLFLAFGMALLVGCGEKEKESSDATTLGAAPITTVSFNKSGAPTVEFSVPDMMCPEGCGEKTKEILSEQPGAREVIIDFESKTATVAIEEGNFDPEQAIAALVDHGFEHSALKGDVAARAAEAPAAVQ